jgi:hypothetical protein
LRKKAYPQIPQTDTDWAKEAVLVVWRSLLSGNWIRLTLTPLGMGSPCFIMDVRWQAMASLAFSIAS